MKSLENWPEYHKSNQEETMVELIYLDNRNKTEMLLKTNHNQLQHNGLMNTSKHSSLFTYKSAGEYLIISGAQLTPQIVGGDSPCSSCFLSIVHL